MALKTKEKLNEENKKVAKPKTVKSKTVNSKATAKKEPKKTVSKTVKKAPSTKKVATKKTNTKKDNVKNVLEKESKVKLPKKETSIKNNKKNVVKKTSTNANKVEENETTISKTIKKSTSSKKVSSKTTKKTSKEATAKNSTSKTSKVEKKKTSRTKKIDKDETLKRKSKAKVISMNTLEYYDLPYRYNQTIVKVLAQNPNTLFVYWDISDEDRLNFEKKYGKEFFYKTRPVLVIHNVTKNYTFEIDINDFANNWYVNVEDTKCKYLVELGRRPNYYESQAIPVNYLNIAFSNTIEIPNDRILFFKDNDKIYFKNIKTNKITEKVLKKETYAKNVKGIYKNYNLDSDNNKFDFNNPSSQNPTSTLL